MKISTANLRLIGTILYLLCGVGLAVSLCVLAEEASHAGLGWVALGLSLIGLFALFPVVYLHSPEGDEP